MKHHLTRALIAPCLIWAVATVGAHAQGHWTSKAPMPIALSAATSGALHGKLYVTAGVDAAHNISTATQIYDPVANTWSSGVPIPAAIAEAEGAVIGDNFFVVGGCMNSDCRIGVNGMLLAFNSVTQSWSTLASMPTPSHQFGLGVAGGHLFAVGGDGACPPCTPLNVLQEYNPATNSWTTLTSMPTARLGVVAGFANGQLFAVGGDSGGGNPLTTVEAYSRSANSWATKASMPAAQNVHGAAVADGHLFSVSGQTTGNVTTNIVQAYDPLDNGWFAVAPIPTARYHPQPVAIGANLYVAGNGANNVATSALEKFTP